MSRAIPLLPLRVFMLLYRELCTDLRKKQRLFTYATLTDLVFFNTDQCLLHLMICALKYKVL